MAELVRQVHRRAHQHRIGIGGVDAARYQHRRQLGPDRGRQRGVVEAGDGEVARHVQAQAVGNGHRGRGHVVVAGKDRGRALLEAQQDLGRVQAGTVREHALHHQLGRRIAAPVGDRGLVAFEPARGGGLVRVADDEADPVVAQRLRAQQLDLWLHGSRAQRP